MSHEREPGEDDVPLVCDLSRFDEAFAAAPETAHEPIPDGRYTVQVAEVELTTTQKSRHPMLRWKLRILEPAEFIGRLLWRNQVLATPANIRWLKSDLRVCGLALSRLSDLPIELWRLREIELEVAKRTRGDRETIYFNRRRDPIAEGARPPR